MSCIRIVDISSARKLIIASASQARLARWKEGLHDLPNLMHIDDLSVLRYELVRIKPDVLLLDHDLPGLDGVRGVCGLRKLSPETKMVLLNGTASDEEEWAMFKAGVRGCCSADIEPSSLNALVGAVQNGELWIRRTLMHRLLEQITEAPSRKDAGGDNNPAPLESLTQREYEIAVRVGYGNSNKQIAQSLDITERTVKAHLTEVFRKLGVSDRLKVAVIFWGNSSSAKMSSASRLHNG